MTPPQLTGQEHAAAPQPLTMTEGQRDETRADRKERLRQLVNVFIDIKLASNTTGMQTVTVQ